MDEAEVVASIVAGDHAGLAEALDTYAESLFAYCHSMLPADEAADAVENTFVIARVKLDGLRDPARLDAWLQAVVRDECFRRLIAKGELPPAFVIDVPDVPVPPGLRGRILKTCTEETATARAHRTSVAHRAGPFGHDGFPKQVAAPGPRSRRRLFTAIAAAVVAAAVTAAVVVASGSNPTHTATAAAQQQAGLGLAASPADASSQAAASQPGHSPTPRPTQPASPSTAATQEPAITPTQQAGPSPSATPAATPSPSATRATPSPTPTQPPQGTLEISSTSIYLESINGRIGARTVTLTAVGGPISNFSITISGAAPGRVVVTPPSGSLAAGQQLIVTVIGSARASFTDYITFSPGNQVLVVHVVAKRKR